VVALAVPLAINVDRRARGDLEASVADAALVVAASVQQALGAPDPPAALRDVVAAYGRQIGARVIVTDAAGRIVADSDGAAAPGEEYGGRPEIAEALRGRRVRAVRYSNDLGQELLVVAVPVVSGTRVIGTVRVSEATSEVQARVRRSWVALGAAGVAVVAAGLAIAAALASSLARPLRDLEDTARKLGAGDLRARAAAHGAPRDVAEVAGALNTMADSVERMVAAQRAFVANASHQVRTPLTGLRLRLESLARADTPEGRHARAAIAEVDRLNALVEDLLQLARAGEAAGEARPVDLTAAAAGAAERWREPAAGKGQAVEVGTGGPVTAAASAGDVDTVLDNLVENAIVYCSAGTRIVVRATERAGGPALVVEDDGPGIAPEDLPHVTERFYRGASRESVPGTGLGLAIVGEIARRWGGSVRVESEGRGTRVTVAFPAPAGRDGGTRTP
jgi:signal transduction histidine kinase